MGRLRYLAIALLSTNLFTMSANSFANPSDGKKAGDAVSLDLLLSPVLSNDGSAHTIVVSYTLTGEERHTPLVLQWDLLAPTPGRSTDEVEHLVVRDARGPLLMKPSPDANNQNILYTSDRTPSGPVAVSYTVSGADPSAPNGRGPHREPITAGGGFTTSGDGILMLPQLHGDINLRLRWKLPPGFEGVSSFGQGDVATKRKSDEILDGFYLAGNFKKFLSASATRGFNAYGLGDSDIDLDELFAWSAKEYEFTRRVFSGSPDTSFRAFYRSYDGGPLDSGRADPNGILLYIAPTHEEALATANLKQLMSHEIIHVFQPQLEERDGEENAWFTEGSADYLAMVIPSESGLISREDYLRQINSEATQYYGNSRRNIPNSAIPGEMWKSADSWMVPYTRGAFYFADLDARVRSRSQGKFTVITLMKELKMEADQSKPHDLAQWKKIVERHAGKEGVEALDNMLAGRTIFPAPGAFGACLKASETRIGVFDLQYSKEPGSNRIASVPAGSNAEHAGLRVGDSLAGNVLMKPFFSETDRALPLPIKRGGIPMTISYVPRIGSVEARTWQADTAKPCEK